MSSFDERMVASFSQHTCQPVASSFQHPVIASWCQPVIAAFGLPATASCGQPADASVEEAAGPVEDNDDLPVSKKTRRQLQFELDDGLVLVTRDTRRMRDVAAVQDEHDAFGKVVAHALRSIADAKVRERTKLRIQELLFEARFG